MRTLALIALTSLASAAACSSDDATKSEAAQIFVTASLAMSSAQARAVADAQPGAVQLALDFNGPCAFGGQVGVTGSYDASGTGDRAAFDMTVVFDACHEAPGTLDGRLRWTSAAVAGSFLATMTGELAWSSDGASASCDFDLAIDIASASARYSGHVCGYDAATELGIGVGINAAN